MKHTITKEYRPWEDHEAPKRIMVWKHTEQRNNAYFICDRVSRENQFFQYQDPYGQYDVDMRDLFINYTRLHEDGSEGPCGVEV